MWPIHKKWHILTTTLTTEPKNQKCPIEHKRMHESHWIRHRIVRQSVCRSVSERRQRWSFWGRLAVLGRKRNFLDAKWIPDRNRCRRSLESRKRILDSCHSAALPDNIRSSTARTQTTVNQSTVASYIRDLDEGPLQCEQMHKAKNQNNLEINVKTM